MQVQIQNLLHRRCQRLVHSWYASSEVDSSLAILSAASICNSLGLARYEQIAGAALGIQALPRIFQVA